MTEDAAEGVTCDFFVSYTQEDRDWAEWIAWWLEEDGYRVLIQAWDMVAGSHWVSRMDQGVQRAARMVAVVSPDYLSSVYGGAEWQAVWAGDPQGQRRKLITVRIRGERPAGLLRGVVGIDLVGLPEAVARRRLRDEIAAAVQGRAKPSSRPPFPRAVLAEPRFPGAIPEVFTVPGRNPHFTGRASELDAILRRLSAGTVITVHGLGGVGKTQLVIEYAHRNATAYDLVGWIDAEQSTLIASQLVALAGPLGLPLDLGLDEPNLGTAVRAVCAELRLRDRWLLIFDNAEDVADIRPVLPGGVGHVLVTTRRGGFGYLGPVHDLDVLPRPDAIALLRRRAPALADDQAGVLAELLGDLPLALEQAAAYLDQIRLPPADYLHLLTTRAGDMYGRGRVIDHRHTIATLWSLSLDQLRVCQPAAVQLLRLCAYLAPEPIPLDVFTIQPSRLPAPLDRVAGDRLALAEAVGALVDYSLVDRTESGLLLHRLVQGVVRESGFDLPDAPVPLPVVLGLLDMVDRLDDECPADWPRFRMLGSHLLVVFDLVAYRMDRATLRYLVASTTVVARAHNSCGALRAAERLLWKILSVSDRLKEHDLNILVARHNLAWTLGVLGQYTESEDMFRTVLSIRRQVLGDEHLNTLRTRHELAWVTASQGRWGEAEAMYRSLLDVYRIFFGEECPDTLFAQHELGWTIANQDREGEAESILCEVVNLRRRVLGKEHPHTLMTRHELAWVTASQGRWGEAETMYRSVLDARRRVLGEEHHHTLTTRLELAWTKAAQGERTTAIREYEEVLDARQRVLGEEHHETVDNWTLLQSLREGGIVRPRHLA